MPVRRHFQTERQQQPYGNRCPDSGSNPNSSGGYTLDGGTLTTTTTQVGLSGGGNFNQFGDSSHTVTGTLTLGVNSGSDGNYNLEGGSLSGTSTTLITTNTVVGNLGTGNFTQSGTDSLHTVSNDLIVGAENSGLDVSELPAHCRQTGRSSARTAPARSITTIAPMR